VKPGLLACLLIVGCQDPTASKTDSPKSVPVEAAASRKAAPPAAPGIADGDPNAVNFCVAAMSHALTCTNDPEFWNHFMTMYFALNQKLSSVSPEMKQAAIDVMKKDFQHLRVRGEPRMNCEMLARTLKLPTAAHVGKILKAISQGCGEYGSALGWLIFGEGVFHATR
jgi:hypothetical protein